MLYYFLIKHIEYFKKIEFFIMYYKNYNISLKEKKQNGGSNLHNHLFRSPNRKY